MASCDPTADTLVIDREEEEVLVPGPSGAEEKYTGGTPAKQEKKEDEYQAFEPEEKERLKMCAEENCTGGMVAKRKRKEDKYQAFEPEEKERLKMYKQLESKAKKILRDTHKKLFDVLSRGNMPEGIMYLKKRLDTLEKKPSLDPICVGLLGAAGAGKTSLLNALLGKQLFLPVSGCRACTSCIVQVKRSRSEQYEAVIHLLSEEEWRDEVKTLVEILQKSGDDDDENTADESVTDAVDKLRAIYGSEAEKKSYEELLKAKLQVSIPAKRSISIKEMEVEQFSEKLVPYIRVLNDGSVALWPLIKHVEVSIPSSDMVPEGITFVDIPGTGDFNKKRDEMWKQSIDQCSVLWVVGEIVRIDGAKVPLMLLDECVQAYLGGNCTDIALVVTKSDLLNLKEYIRGDRRNKTTHLDNKRDAILERNEIVKTTMEGRIRNILKKKLLPDSEVIHKPDLVYMVSAEEFWNTEHLGQEETEIPKLREYLRKLYLKETERLLNDYLEEIRGIHLLAENIGSKEQLVEVHFRESSVEEFVNSRMDALGKKLDQCFSQMEQPLREGVANARRLHEKIVTRMLTRSDGYQGFHRTLKAVCLKNGVFPSRTFARLDLNEDLANPIYEKIASVFGSIFRKEGMTRASLWSHLNIFQEEVNEKIRQIAKERKIPDDNSKTGTFIHEIDVILKRLWKEILRRKTVIYWALPRSIQSSLRPHYEEASKVRGHKACDRMKSILHESIVREVKNNMFEKAKSQMSSYVLELKEEIMLTLKKEIPTVLKLLLLQEDELAVKLPDIEQECRGMKKLIETLQTSEQ